MESLQSAFGIVVLIAIAWLASERRRRLPWRIVLGGLGLQFLLAGLLLKVPPVRAAFSVLNGLVSGLDQATKAGAGFIFGYLGGAPLPFAETSPGASFIVAFQVLPIILVVSALSSVLFYWGILQKVVQAFAFLLRKAMNVGGAMGLGVAANIFLGIIEAPLLIKPYLARMSRAELFVIMTSSMGSVAGTVMVLYATVLAQTVPDAAVQILVASVISAPASVLIAWVMVPGDADTRPAEMPAVKTADSAMDALIQGTMEGVQMCLGVAAVIIVLFALVSLANQGLALVSWGDAPLTLQSMLGWVFRPLCWAMGIPWAETQAAGALMGTKTVLNEFVAYMEMARLPAEVLSERSRMIMTYAMCGFANFASLGILLGGMGTAVPERRQEIVRLGLRSLLSGALTTMMTGAVIGVLVA